MNIAYYRKSKFSKEETIKNLRSNVSNFKLDIIGEVDLESVKGTLFQVCNNDWVGKLISKDRNIIGLLPCSILVMDNDGEVTVGSSNPAILGSVTQDTDIHSLAAEAETVIKKLVNEATGAGEQKVEGLKLFSTTTCPYCSMEKDWLESNNIKHEVIYVDKDQKEAEKMVRNTGQMGVPVTEVRYEDGDVEYIVGFDKVQLSKLLNL